MRLPDGSILMVEGPDGLRHEYDANYARQYYLRTRKLKGRKKGATADTGLARNSRARSGLQPKKNPAVRARQRQALAQRIQTLEGKLHQLETLIRKRQQEERKSAQEAKKPDTAAEKRKQAKTSKEYRDKNQQKVKSAAKKDSKASGGSAKKKSGTTQSTAELKKLATKVKGQIAVAKQKLATL